MDQQNKESVLSKYLPSSRQLVIHFIAMITLACLLGPLLGPWLIHSINPTQAWGVAARVGDYSLLNVLLWGLAFLMFEALIYTGWLISLGRKGWEKEQPKSWYN
jgi:MFS family permease